MDNSKDQSSKIANTDENPSNNTQSPVDSSLLPAVSVENGNPNRPSAAPRTPFTNLSQVDADLALARTLQDQERAYMMLRMNGDGSDHESWETGSYVHDDDDEFDHHNSEYEGSEANEEEEDAFDVHAHLDLGSGEEDRSNQGVELDPASFPNDEAYARALQDAEDQEMAARLLALTGINEMVTEEDDDVEEHGGNSQGTWEDVDPDELSYEKQRTGTLVLNGAKKLLFFVSPKKELLALGEVVGTESRGLSADSISSLRSIVYKIQNNQNGSSDTCVICRLDYEDGENLILLSCKHSYHSECITNWLQINKVCPVCSTEVSTSGTAS